MSGQDVFTGKGAEVTDRLYDRGGPSGRYDEGYWAEPTWRGYAYGWEEPSRETWDRTGPYTGRGPRGYWRSDERIHEDVCERLMYHGHIDASDIEVNVDNGEVTLQGTVDNRQAKYVAEDLTESAMGVKNVRNHLRVRREGEVRPAVLENLRDVGERPRESLS